MPSFYLDSISRYIELFKKDKVKIIIYEEFAENTEEAVQETLDFLHIDAELPSNLSKKYNDFTHPLGKSQNFIVSNKLLRPLGRNFLPKSTRLSIKNMLSDKNEKPILQEDDILKLRELFSSDVTALENFLEQKLPWKNF